MDSLEKLVAEGVITVKEFYEDRTEKDLVTGEIKKVRSFYKKYYDTRTFVKTFNPVISKMVKVFAGDPKAQFLFIIMSILEENKETTDVSFAYKDFCKICDKHEIKYWTRAQLCNCLKWLVEQEFLSKLDGSMYRINFRYFYNGSILKPLGINKPVVQTGSEPIPLDGQTA